MFAKFLARLRQPSTIVGLTAIGVLVGIPPGSMNLAGQAVVAVAGLVGVFTDEAASK
jgi:hypothetical protein